MNEITEMISKGEGLHTEFKETLKDNHDIAKIIVCFANSDGGQILIGVNDKGVCVGTNNLDKLTRKIDDVAYNRCEPPVTVVQEVIDFSGKKILAIKVPKGNLRPYRTASGHYYVRSSNKCRQASREELLRLFQATESLYYDENSVFKASVQDIDMYAVKRFFADYFGMKIAENDLLRYLVNIRALSGNQIPTVSGVLFFCENPQQFFPNARVVAAYINGNDISIPPADKKSFEGRIPQIIEDLIRFLRIYIKEQHIIEGFKPERYPEIEEYALREAVINSIAHRDYTVSAPVRILIYTDRIEFRTPGKLPNSVTIDSIKIGGAHILRNPTIYNLLGKMGLVTDMGSGVKRIVESINKTVGKEVIFNVTDNEFVMTMPRKREDSLEFTMYDV